MQNLVSTFHDRQLQTIGKILAGYSHELKNHLATIKESNGLMSDLLGRGIPHASVLQTKLLKLTETIDKRVSMVAAMAISLNGFAHRYDTPLCPFQLNDIINEELCFLDRFAHLQSIGLSISFSEGLPMVYGNPSLIQFVFANLFFYLLATLQPGGEITVSSGQEESFVHFLLRPEGKMHENRPEIATVDHDQELQAALKVVGSRLAMQSSDGTIRTIICNIPISNESKSK